MFSLSLVAGKSGRAECVPAWLLVEFVEML